MLYVVHIQLHTHMHTHTSTHTHAHTHTYTLNACSYNIDSVIQAWEDLPIIAHQ